MKCKWEYNEIVNSKWVELIVGCLLGIILLCIYSSKITHINTVWELGDEAGYLCNAAYFSGTDWGDVAARLPYYGFGYSVVLTPLFWICHTGIQLIRGAIMVNILCIILLYVLEVYVLSHIYKRSMAMYVCAFISCMHPYLMTSTFKVLCETILSMWIFLIAFFLIRLMETNRILDTVLLGIATGYILYIHTRAIVIIPIVIMLTVTIYKMKQISLGNFVGFIVTLVVTLVVLYLMKKGIITHSMRMETGDTRETTNMLSGNYLWTRITWFIHDFPLYIIAFNAKLFYLIISTGGIICFGVWEAYEGVKESVKGRNWSHFTVLLFFGAIFIVMLLACTLNGVGISDNFTYLFYSRYYEYVTIPMILLGIYSIVFREYKKIVYAIFVIITAITGIITQLAGRVYLNTWEIHLDTARIPGFSYLILEDDNFNTFILHGTLYGIVLVTLLAWIKQRKYTFAVLILAVCILGSSSRNCIDRILEVNERAYADEAVVEYFKEKKVTEVVFLNTEYEWSEFYSRMQVLLKDKKLRVIEEQNLNQLEAGTYFVSYANSKIAHKMEESGKLVKKGADFGIYCK